jgi:hypothetical protein
MADQALEILEQVVMVVLGELLVVLEGALGLHMGIIVIQSVVIGAQLDIIFAEIVLLPGRLQALDTGWQNN